MPCLEVLKGYSSSNPYVTCYSYLTTLDALWYQCPIDFIAIDTNISEESFAAVSTLGKGAVVQCVAWVINNICILYTSKVLKWGKVLMQIFSNLRGMWFLAHMCQIFIGVVTDTVYGSAHTEFLVFVLHRYLFLITLLVECM